MSSRYLTYLNSKDIIFNEFYINWDLPVYLVEGVFDSLRIPNSIPLLGKGVSPLLLKRLLENNFEVVAIGKKTGIVNGVKIHTFQKVFKNIDTVTLYLNAKNQIEYYNYIIDLKPRRVIFNPGAENEEFEKLLSLNNIAWERSCTLVMLSIGEY